MTRPDLLDTFQYQGRTINVEWFDVDDVNNLPHVQWQQVYAVCNLDGKIPIVLYENARANLPGGHTETGESLAETLHREIDEELNCRVLNWRPIGYQKLTEAGSDETTYQLRVYAEIESMGEFVEDIGGSVIGFKLVDLEDLNSEIGYGKVGERLIKLLESKF